MASGCAAVVQVSDRTALHNRGLTLLGEGGTLELADRTYALRGRDGVLVDERRAGESEPGVDAAFADLIVTQWRRVLDRGPSVPSSSEFNAHVLACCLATLLSARTAEAESPRNILRMHGL